MRHMLAKTAIALVTATCLIGGGALAANADTLTGQAPIGASTQSQVGVTPPSVPEPVQGASCTAEDPGTTACWFTNDHSQFPYQNVWNLTVTTGADGAVIMQTFAQNNQLLPWIGATVYPGTTTTTRPISNTVAPNTTVTVSLTGMEYVGLNSGSLTVDSLTEI